MTCRDATGGAVPASVRSVLVPSEPRRRLYGPRSYGRRPATTCSGAFGRPRIVRARTATCSSLDDCRSTFYVAVRNVSLDGEFDRFVRGGSPERGGYTIGDARKECFVGEIDMGRQG